MGQLTRMTNWNSISLQRTALAVLAGTQRGGSLVIREKPWRRKFGSDSSRWNRPRRIVGIAQLDANGQLLIAAHCAGVERDRALLVHGPRFVSLDGLFECDFALHSG
jgi:hypothetical protein